MERGTRQRECDAEERPYDTIRGSGWTVREMSGGIRVKRRGSWRQTKGEWTEYIEERGVRQGVEKMNIGERKNEKEIAGRGGRKHRRMRDKDRGVRKGRGGKRPEGE